MNDLQIQCFLAVAKHMNFSKAAQERYTSQPSVSKQIRRLEENIGVPLFDRDGPALRLTPEGEKFRNFFQDCTRSFHQLQEEALAASKKSVRLRIAFLQGSSFFDDLFPVFSQLSAAYPKLNIEVCFYGFKAIIEAFDSGEADIIVHLEELTPRVPGMRVEPLMDIPRLLFYRADLFPDGAQPSSLLDFAGERFLITNESECPGVKQSNLRLAAAYDFRPKFKYVPNIESMIWGVKHGDGVAIMDSSVIWGNAPIRSLALPEQHTVVMAWRELPKNKSVEIFTNKFVAAVRQGPFSG